MLPHASATAKGCDLLFSSNKRVCRAPLRSIALLRLYFFLRSVQVLLPQLSFVRMTPPSIGIMARSNSTPDTVPADHCYLKAKPQKRPFIYLIISSSTALVTGHTNYFSTACHLATVERISGLLSPTPPSSPTHSSTSRYRFSLLSAHCDILRRP